MPGSVSRHDAQAMTPFTFEPVNQTPRFFVSEFGCFTTTIAKHGPILILKIAGHKDRGARVKGKWAIWMLKKFFPSYPFPFNPLRITSL